VATPIEKPRLRQYWDACLFINYLTNLEPDKAEIMDQILIQAEAPRSPFRIVISDLVVAEVRPSEAYEQTHRDRIEQLFDSDLPYLEPYALTRTIAHMSRQIGADFPNLTVADSIHVATAIHARADVLFTYDGDRSTVRRRSGDLLRYNGQIGDPPLTIETPWVYSGPLDAALKQLSEPNQQGQ